ncbi:swi5-like zinc finger protein [Blastocladiella emersonii ATCC 22665]|nr:swi5-like zinc finger protein [Blastocladiella emersonii ATCC 22665]
MTVESNVTPPPPQDAETTMTIPALPFPVAMSLAVLEHAGTAPGTDAVRAAVRERTAPMSDADREPVAVDVLFDDPRVGFAQTLADFAADGLVRVSDGNEGKSWELTDAGTEYLTELRRNAADAAWLDLVTAEFGQFLAALSHRHRAQAGLDTAVAALGERGTSEADAIAALEAHVSNLHKYNEYQDLAQTAMGQIAVLDGVTVKRVYQDLGIELPAEAPARARRSV